MLRKQDITDEMVEEKIIRCEELRDLNRDSLAFREKVKDLIEGGPRGMARLTGNDSLDEIDADMIPVMNYMQMANTRLAQKIGHRPDTKVDAPASSDDARVHRYAQKRRRYVDTLDDLSELELQLPQQGRWLPGYAFMVWTIRLERDLSGQPYPHAEMRDPFNCFPGQVGTRQKPKELAFITVQTPEALAERFPEHEDKLLAKKEQDDLNRRPRERGGVVLQGTDGVSQSTWGNQSGEGIEVYEYWDKEGTWWIAPDRGLLLAYTPNPLKSGPAFVFKKRFSFSQWESQYNHIVGLMANVAKLNLLSVKATEMAVFAETNVIGDTVDGEYHKGDNATNILTHGSKVEKMNDRVPFEVFQQIDRLVAMLRAGASYPVTEDAGSPISFVTGQGIAELTASMDLEVREYQTLFRYALQELDFKRLEYAQAVWPTRKVTINGAEKDGAFTETITPKTHIDGNYKTRRVYGIMAGWDEPNKIAGGANLLQLEIIDEDTMRENIDGLEDHQKIKERIRDKKIEKVLFEGLLAQVQAAAQEGGQVDPRLLQGLIGMLSDGELKELFEEQYLGAVEEQAQEAQQQDPMAGSPGAMPDAATVMAQLSGANAENPEGAAGLGVQRVGRA